MKALATMTLIMVLALAGCGYGYTKYDHGYGHGGYGYGYRGYGHHGYGHRGYGHHGYGYRGYGHHGYGHAGSYGHGGSRVATTMDIIDARNNEPIWRGWANPVLDHDPDREKAQMYVDEAVRKMLEEFPPTDFPTDFSPSNSLSIE